ncbi:M48 family metallopeptidase [Halorubrum lacusprofundi]|jgi:heat shock protein HtpX|uniref:Peptidase M48 Ste24p n=1 Tax=Halorubrum lacusprofundi (strain ATCC 49239 / DSM 5036 / JCM 8891 / ACAM 34) TaxID=416348 RepID=B9LQH2_HALLT|nr:M48 family metalloprotease [Halorubrum lacusprofundi]ACM57593.1 peptidase M48 Ste24p [Halorubrum lacusprofundi ATCC 49239]MCG1005810.1 M48 family metalloprotease [Halorubrum lacusprofundi]
MSRLAFRAAAAVVGVALLAVYLAAAAFVADALLFLWATRPDLPVLLALLAVVAVGSAYLSYWIGTAQVLASLEGDRLPRERAPDLHHRIDALAARMAVDRPALYVTDARAPNAFAVGGGSGGGALVMDRSLFRILSAREVEAIVAHELAHLETNDGLALAMADGIGRAVVGFTTVLALPALLALSGLAAASAWIRGRPGDRSGPFAWLHRALTNGLFAGFVLATLLARSRSRKREFAADDRAAEVTGDPIALARALRRIERAAEPSWPFTPLSTYKRTENPAERWLSTHPSIEERVERLRRRAAAQESTRRIPIGPSRGGRRR